MSRKKQAILHSATVLFAQKGFKDTAIAELAKATQVAEGTIFYHFKNKTDLFLAVLEGVREGIISEFERYIGGRRFDTGLAMVEEVIAFYLYLASHQEAWFLLLHRHYPYELARMNTECRGHLEAIYNALVDLFEGAIATGQADGSIDALPSRKTAFILFSMVNGLIWLKSYGLYDPATFYKEVLSSCRRILAPHDKEIE